MAPARTLGILVVGLLGLTTGCRAAEVREALATEVSEARDAEKNEAREAAVRIDRVPHVRQKPDFCGEACLEMVLRRLGKPAWTQDRVFDVSGVDPAEGRGCWTRDLVKAARTIGFRTGEVWTSIGPGEQALEDPWRALHGDLARGIPSIVCMRFAPDNPAEHFRLVVGYDAEKDEVLHHDPAVKSGAYRRLSRETFLSLWPMGTRGGERSVIRLRMAPGEKLADPPKPRPGERFTNADYAQHVRALKEKLPHPAFTIVVEPPFVVIGDESPGRVMERSRRTVRWAVDLLKKDYFAADPHHILDIWLFRNRTSYRQHAFELFGHRPGTPYGYYSEQHRALVMNIATGGGTLVHEIVHPFVAANFPTCPPWFNEGLGSLYEQCSERSGRIVGLTNWRLPGLQEAIRKKKLLPFRELTALTPVRFYGADSGLHYAQARYLLYHLQEKGLLRRYYREFFAARRDDPTGYETLARVLGQEDMTAFQTRWEAWVLTLRFP
jgi:hypothetical protein